MKYQKISTVILIFFFNTNVQTVEKCYECAGYKCETLRVQKCSETSWPIKENGNIVYKVNPNYTGTYYCISLYQKLNNPRDRNKGCIAETKINETIKDMEKLDYKYSVCRTDLCNINRKCIECNDVTCNDPKPITCPSEDFSCIAVQGIEDEKTVKSKGCLTKNEAKLECEKNAEAGIHCYFCDSDYCNNKTISLKKSHNIEEDDTAEELYFSVIMISMMLVLLNLFK